MHGATVGADAHHAPAGDDERPDSAASAYLGAGRRGGPYEQRVQSQATQAQSRGPEHPRLDHTVDPELAAARDAAFDILYRSARTSAGADPDRDLTGLVVAGWSLAHGFATLWRTANLQDRLGANPETFARQLAQGVVTLGELANRQLTNAPDPGSNSTHGSQP
ncbi:MAG TPA: TetR-like C-terminal domain-containing protein [Pseudonocardia sp.]|nr:TetR-like C-terminal domain-containing protein [Pseudonocardia sp.]